MLIPEGNSDTSISDARSRASEFQAYCMPLKGGTASDSDQRFRAAFGRLPTESFASRGWSVQASLQGPAAVGTDPAGRVTVLLHGELYEPSPRTAAGLAAAYAQRGDALFKELNGSFTLLVLDHQADRLLVVPDRVRSRRVFHSWDGVSYRLTTRLADHPTDQLPFDPVGVAWVLSSGSCFGPRTLFKGISIFERAHVHELHATRIESDEYWSHAVHDPAEPPDPERQAAEYEEILIEAVRRRLEGAGEIFLSLSAGHDSKCIAAVLARRLKVPEVRAFSYTRLPLRPTTDAGVATRIAARLGLEHRIVNSYEGDYVRYLRRNAALGEGMVRCFGVDGWLELRDTFLAAEAPILLVGEEYLGVDRSDVPDMGALRAKMRFRDLVFSTSVRRHLPDDLFREMREGLDADVDAIFRRQPPTANLWQTYACCAFDQRCGNVVLPWREAFPVRWMRVRHPWLDRDVLDYGATVGWAQREDKRLFRRVIARMDAELEAMQREQQEGYRANYMDETRAHAAALREWLSTTESRLDDLIPVEFGHALLKAACRPPLPRPVGRIVRGVRRRLPGREAVNAPNPAHSFRTYAILRMAWPKP